MTWMTFTVEIVKALAWPVTVIFLLLVLRKSLVALIPTLRELQYKEFRLMFGKKLEEAAARADEVLPVPREHWASYVHGWRASESSTQFQDWLVASPGTVVMEAWLQVEIALNRALERVGQHPTRPARDAVRKLASSGQLPRDVEHLIIDMSDLRNKAAHAAVEISREQALEFAGIAARVVEAINRIGKKQNDAESHRG